jgi:hypothetical protein
MSLELESKINAETSILHSKISLNAFTITDMFSGSIIVNKVLLLFCHRDCLSTRNPAI